MLTLPMAITLPATVAVAVSFERFTAIGVAMPAVTSRAAAASRADNVQSGVVGAGGQRAGQVHRRAGADQSHAAVVRE